MPRSRSTWRSPIVFVVAALALGLLLAACAKEPTEVSQTAAVTPIATAVGVDPVQRADETLQAVAHTFNDKDIDGYLAHWTDKAMQEAFGITREEGRQYLATSIGRSPIAFQNLSNVQSSNGTITTEADFIEGPMVKHARFTLIEQDGVGKIDGLAYLPTDIPGDATAVDLKLKDFAFDFDPAAITTGRIAFRVTNEGKQPHEIVITKVPADMDLLPAYEQALQTQTAPTGVQDVGYVNPVAPGQSTNVVFTNALEPGRYALLCFVPDADDPNSTPHFKKGMVAEFTVP